MAFSDLHESRGSRFLDRRSLASFAAAARNDRSCRWQRCAASFRAGGAAPKAMRSTVEESDPARPSAVVQGGGER
jgi:hypothetical protein